MKRWMIVVGILLALPLLWILAGTGLAARREKATERAWAEMGLPIDDLPARYPKTAPSKAALEIEAAAVRLGIGLAPRGDTSRVQPGQDAVQHLERLHIAKFVDAQLARADDTLDPVPVELSAFLAAHAADIEAVCTASGGELAWDNDLEKLFAAPIPMMKGHRDLQAVLSLEAIDSIARGDSSGALAALSAGWRIDGAFARRPELISQLVAINLDRPILGLLRKVPVVPEEWRTRVRERDFAKALLASLQVEAWIVSAFARRDGSSMSGAAGEAADQNVYQRWIGRPLERPYLRLAGASHSEIMRHMVEELKAQDLCTMDVTAFDAKVRGWVPRWNVLSAMAVPSLGLSWRLAARSALDAELTQKIIETRNARAASGGPWPAAADAPSSVCPGLNWKYQVAGETASWNASANPFGEKAAGLPLSFTLR